MTEQPDPRIRKGAPAMAATTCPACRGSGYTSGRTTSGRIDCAQCLGRGIVPGAERAMTEQPDPRIRKGAPAYVVDAAAGPPSRAGQENYLLHLLTNNLNGLTSKQMAKMVRHMAGDVPFATSNQVGARLIGLFEQHRAAPLRERGQCRHGVCLPHDPRNGKRHRPTDACSTHGELVVRDRAAVWQLTGGTGRLF